MNKEIEKIKKNVLEFLDGKQNIKDDSFTEEIYKLLRLCLQNEITELNIGNYYLNIIPQEITVNYKNNIVYLEVSNKDIYEEYEIVDNCYYYIIKNKENDYNEDSPVIKVSNKIIKSSPLYSENLYFEFFHSNGQNISDYLKKKEELNIEKDNYATAYKYFNINDDRLEEETFLDMKKVMLVSHQKNGSYKPTYKTAKIKYKDLIPNIEIKEEKVKILYEKIIDFYKKYI